MPTPYWSVVFRLAWRHTAQSLGWDHKPNKRRIGFVVAAAVVSALIYLLWPGPKELASYLMSVLIALAGGFFVAVACFVVDFLRTPARLDRHKQREIDRFRNKERAAANPRLQAARRVVELCDSLYDFRQVIGPTYPGGSSAMIAKYKSLMVDLFNAIYAAYSPGEAERFLSIRRAEEDDHVRYMGDGDTYEYVYARCSADIERELRQIIKDNDAHPVFRTGV